MKVRFIRGGNFGNVFDMPPDEAEMLILSGDVEFLREEQRELPADVAVPVARRGFLSRLIGA